MKIPCLLNDEKIRDEHICPTVLKTTGGLLVYAWIISIDKTVLLQSTRTYSKQIKGEQSKAVSKVCETTGSPNTTELKSFHIDLSYCIVGNIKNEKVINLHTGCYVNGLTVLIPIRNLQLPQILPVIISL